MKLRLAGVLAMLVSSGATGAFAQNPAAPDGERLRLAEQVVQAAGGTSAATSLNKIMGGVAIQLTEGQSPEQRTKFLEAQAFERDRLAYYIPQFLHAQALAYARAFSTVELTNLLAFYRSPTGEALQARLPQVTLDTFQAMQPILSKLQRDMFAHQCAVTPCTAAQKATLAKLQAAAAD